MPLAETLAERNERIRNDAELRSLIQLREIFRNKGIPLGYAPLDASGKIPSSMVGGVVSDFPSLFPGLVLRRNVTNDGWELVEVPTLDEVDNLRVLFRKLLLLVVDDGVVSPSSLDEEMECELVKAISERQ